MTAPPRRKPIGKAEEVHLVDDVKNRHQGMLDDLVFQGGNAQGPHASIRLGDVGPLGGLGPIGQLVSSALRNGRSGTLDKSSSNVCFTDSAA